MPLKVITSGVLLVIMASMLVFVIELFLPLSAKSDLNILCRGTLLKMENKGGITEEEKTSLKTELASKGFVNVSVTGTLAARQGETVNLKVVAYYKYSKLVSLLSRTQYTQCMVYDRTAMSRKVIN